MFVVLSRFTVGNDMTADVKKAFQNRPHLVDNEPGFKKLDVISPQENPDEIWLVTYWQDERAIGHGEKVISSVNLTNLFPRVSSYSRKVLG